MATTTDYVKELVNLPWHITMVPECPGGYSTSVLEMPGCFSLGETAEDAMAHTRDAMESWLLSVIAAGQNIPEPLETSSGTVLLRMPRSLKALAQRRAAFEGVSLNALLVSLVSWGLGSKEPNR